MNNKYNYNNLTIGSDPEVFVRDFETKELASIIGVFNAGKNDPLDIGTGCFVQEDNILAEFNIPPCKTREEFLNSINYAKSYIEMFVAPLGMELHYSSSEIATEELLLDPKAHVFGCSPSYNAITECSSDIAEEDTSELTMRSSGFHIHYGWDNPTEDERDRLCMMFELAVSLPLILEDNDDHNRRSLYGKIGDCRDKDYGIECRSLGGYFLKSDDSILNVWDRSVMAVKMAEELEISNEDLRKDILNYINPESDLEIENVNELIEKYKIKEYVNI